MSPLIEVYFDGKCSVCRKKISYYQLIAPQGVFAWHDIMQDKSVLVGTGISLKSALMALHIKDATGNWHQGLDSFIIIWSHLPKWRLRMQAKLLAMPIIHGLASFVYYQHNKYRYAKNNYCELD